MKVAITVCAYNEAKNIRSVLERSLPYGKVILVDDGSSDNTADIAREYGVQVVRHPINLGQGLATLSGFKVALDGDFDVIVGLDGDGQHDPDEIDNFIEKMEETGSDIVMGSRILGSDYAGAPWARRFFLRPLTWVINVLSGYKITDSMCGYRVFRSESLRRVLPVLDQMREPQYLAAEMLIRFGRAGLTLSEVPITLQDRTGGVSTKGLFRYGWGVSRAILKTLFERRR